MTFDGLSKKPKTVNFISLNQSIPNIDSLLLGVFFHFNLNGNKDENHSVIMNYAILNIDSVRLIHLRRNITYYF